MRLARFIHSGNYLEGREENGQLIDPSGKSYSPKDVVWLPPSIPTKIVGLVLNYSDHADELGLSSSEDPVIFLKPPSSLIGNLDGIVYPEGAKYVHYEGELCAIIGKWARNVPADQAMEYVLGFTIANDVTARDFITNTFRPPVKAKGFDTFCPVGPFLVTPETGDGSNLKIKTLVNGEVRQNGTTSDMIHPIPKIIEFLSSFMSLLPGDMILTGTPKGISPINPGDRVEIEIETLGKLVNAVVAEKKRNPSSEPQ